MPVLLLTVPAGERQERNLFLTHRRSAGRHSRITRYSLYRSPFTFSLWQQVSFAVKEILQPLHHGYERRTFRRAQLADLYYVSDLWADGKVIAKLSPSDHLVLRVNPSGVRMVKLIPRSRA